MPRSRHHLGRQSLGRRADHRRRLRRRHDPLDRASDGAELLAFFVYVPDKTWIAWTPSGYYAASPGGEDLIGWHVNGKGWDDTPDFFPASRFRERFYRPDIVQLVLITLDEAKAIEEANAAADRKTDDDSLVLPPVVELIADPRGIEAKERTRLQIPLALAIAAPGDPRRGEDRRPIVRNRAASTRRERLSRRRRPDDLDPDSAARQHHQPDRLQPTSRRAFPRQFPSNGRAMAGARHKAKALRPPGGGERL